LNLIKNSWGNIISKMESSLKKLLQKLGHLKDMELKVLKN